MPAHRLAKVVVIVRMRAHAINKAGVQCRGLDRRAEHRGRARRSSYSWHFKQIGHARFGDSRKRDTNRIDNRRAG